MSDDVNNRVVLTVRLEPELKDAFARAARDAGMEPGTAARQVLELIARSLSEGRDYLDVLLALRSSLKPKVRVHAGTAP